MYSFFFAAKVLNEFLVAVCRVVSLLRRTKFKSWGVTDRIFVLNWLYVCVCARASVCGHLTCDCWSWADSLSDRWAPHSPCSLAFPGAPYASSRELPPPHHRHSLPIWGKQKKRDGKGEETERATFFFPTFNLHLLFLPRVRNFKGNNPLNWAVIIKVT